MWNKYPETNPPEKYPASPKWYLVKTYKDEIYEACWWLEGWYQTEAGLIAWWKEKE